MVRLISISIALALYGIGLATIGSPFDILVYIYSLL